MRLTAAVLALLAVAACERAKKEEPAPTAPSIEVREVAAADGFGEAGDAVTAVAFWSHPSVNFESLLIAATDAGVKAYSIETGEAVASAVGVVSDISVFYIGAGATAQGYAIARSAGAYSIHAIANDAPALTPLAVSGDAPGADAFCVSGGLLYEAGSGKLAARDIAIMTGGAVIGDARTVAEAPGVTACHIDDRSGAVITIGEDGAIKRIDPKTGESFGLAFIGNGEASATSLFLMTTAEPENAPGGALAVLDSESGVISLFDLTDGHSLGAIRIKSTFDLDAVASAETIAAGYGNYGGVYRDGALAVVTKGDGAPIRLAPWNGVLDALKLTPGENVDPREPQPAAADELLIDIEFKQP